MDIEEEILARVQATKVWDKQARLEDFQIKAADNGFVLINLKTRRAYLIYDEFSELHDWEQLFPDGLEEKIEYSRRAARGPYKMLGLR
ncbi:MAG TPA: hypothetical protein VGH23_08645 [Rhizomicrobium sp.]|jgi:hypothetical protein